MSVVSFDPDAVEALAVLAALADDLDTVAPDDAATVRYAFQRVFDLAHANRELRERAAERARLDAEYIGWSTSLARALELVDMCTAFGERMAADRASGRPR